MIFLKNIKIIGILVIFTILIPVNACFHKKETFRKNCFIPEGCVADYVTDNSEYPDAMQTGLPDMDLGVVKISDLDFSVEIKTSKIKYIFRKLRQNVNSDCPKSFGPSELRHSYTISGLNTPIYLSIRSIVV